MLAHGRMDGELTTGAESEQKQVLPLRQAQGQDEKFLLRREVEVHVVARGYGRAVERGWLVVPAAKRGFDLFVDAVADGLHDLGFDYVALESIVTSMTTSPTRSRGSSERSTGGSG